MRQIEVTVKFPDGLHARPAVKLIKLASEQKAKITIEKDGESYLLKNITALLGACISCGDTILLRAEGEEEESAIAALQGYFA